MVYDMLWSDPSSPEQEHSPDLDQKGFGMSARGCTCFGEKSIDLFLEIHNFKHVFRGHEAQQSGVGVSKGARLTTIFSTSVSAGKTTLPGLQAHLSVSNFLHQLQPSSGCVVTLVNLF
jgi:hypothetical protein